MHFWLLGYLSKWNRILPCYISLIASVLLLIFVIFLKEVKTTESKEVCRISISFYFYMTYRNLRTDGSLR